MTGRQETRSRARMCAARRRSPCYRHPEEPITGICASCLRERLYGLDVTAAAGAELRRCKSVVSDAKSGSLYEPRRKSCDAVSNRSSLSELFGEEDLNNRSESEPRVDSENAVGVSRLPRTAIESKDRIRVPAQEFGGDGDGDGEDEEGESKTMREFIDLEISKKTRKSKDLREMASAVSKKLLKWRKKNNNNKETKKPENTPEITGIETRNLKFFHYRQKLRESHSPIVGGRRSCDAGPSFPLDAGRISLEQPRASWDGYMIARAIPRLAPMFSAVDNGILCNRFEKNGLSMDGTMHSIAEDKSSSGASGSSNSNSDSSSSMRRSSFDRSTSVRSTGKKVIGYEDCGNVKLVITEKELKDWNMTSSRDNGLEKMRAFSSNTASTDGVCDSGTSVKKPVPWRRLRKAFGFRVKNKETFNGAASEHSMDHTGIDSWRIGSVNSFDPIEPSNGRTSVDGSLWSRTEGNRDYGLKRNNSVNHSSSYLDTSFYVTPLRNRNHSNRGKSMDYIAESSLNQD